MKTLALLFAVALVGFGQTIMPAAPDIQAEVQSPIPIRHFDPKQVHSTP